MASIPYTGAARYVVKTIMDNGDTALNVLHGSYSLSTGATDAYLLSVCQEKGAEYAAALAPFLDTDANISEVTAYNWNTTTQEWDNSGTATLNVAGTNTTGSLPSGNAYMVLLRTQSSRVVGRVYCPPFCTDNIDDDGELTAGAISYLATLVAAITDFMGGTDGSMTPGVWSRKNLAMYTFTGSASLPLSMSYQRRRKRGRGI